MHVFYEFIWVCKNKISRIHWGKIMSFFDVKMGENSTSNGHLNLDMGSNFLRKSVSDFLAETLRIHDSMEKSSKLDFLVQCLEGEMGKIDAFKRDLPHCMHLLKDAIEKLKKEKMQQEMKGKKAIDVDCDGRAKRSNDFLEKKNWMSSVQLWSTPVQYDNNLSLTSSFSDEGRGFAEKPLVGLGCNFVKGGGAFLPFKKQQKGVDSDSIAGLSLSIPMDEESGDRKSIPGVVRQQRKQRRCWSPELHQRFIEALQILGGPQMATPKQIREIMKVEGLTNDEVKSHLQKYRLHIRKLPGSLSGLVDLSWMNAGGNLAPSKRASGGSPLEHLSGGDAGSAGAFSSSHDMESQEEDEDLRSESCSRNGRFRKMRSGKRV